LWLFLLEGVREREKERERKRAKGKRADKMGRKNVDALLNRSYL